MKKKELWILIVIALGAILGMVFLSHRPAAYTGSSTEGGFVSQSGVVVAVQHRNEIVLEFDPEVDAVYDIEGDVGGLQVEVKDGKWHVINEQCPNHICASMGWVGPDDLIPITCLPNNIMIFVESSDGD
jgi:hypothetical protein